MPGRLREIIFPVLERAPDADATARDEEEADLELISSSDWSKHADVALEEARRLADAETARRQNADGKATTYLAAAAALVPITITLQNAVWNTKGDIAPAWMNASGLVVATGYIAMAGYWAFQTLQVSASHRADIHDMAEAWQAPDPRRRLITATFKATRMNWNGVNRKVSCVKLTHAFLLRAFIVFTGLLALNALWTVYGQIEKRLTPSLTKPVLPVVGTSKVAFSQKPLRLPAPTNPAALRTAGRPGHVQTPAATPAGAAKPPPNEPIGPHPQPI